MLVLVTSVIIFNIIAASLPDIITPQDYKPWVMSEVYAKGGEKIGEFYEHRRKLIALQDIPDSVKKAFISAEDSHFYSHRGVDMMAIFRAALINFKARRFEQGGSTITQQVARSLLLTREKKLSRKIKEAILAMKLEKHLSKDEILYLYLNEIYLGHGAYGIVAASENYFGKDVRDLTLAEAAILAGLPQAPSRYSPLINPQSAKERQVYVLRQMVGAGYISKKEAFQANEAILEFHPRSDLNLTVAPYFVEHVRRYLLEKYGFEKVMHEGLQIYTTLDIAFQKQANTSIEKGLREVDKRQGYRGPLEHFGAAEKIKTFLEGKKDETFEAGEIYQGIVTQLDDRTKEVLVSLAQKEDKPVQGKIPFQEIRWARKPDPNKYYLYKLLQKPSEAFKVGDLIEVRIIEKKEDAPWHFNLEQMPIVEGALFSFEPKTGHVKAMVGGLDYRRSEFNRVIQGERQVGSTFKPIIYGAALEKGYTPASVIVDSPIIYQEGEKEIEDQWKPRNYAQKFYGDTIFANALAYSRNIVTIKIVQDIKIETVIEFAKRLGITAPLIEDLSMALGSSSLTLEEMCKVFAIYANQGKKQAPIYITKVVDRYGEVLEAQLPLAETEQVVTPELAYLMTNLLQGVVKRGTGKDVNDLNWPLAAKTGTTSDYADAWFMGYSPELLTGVWVGHDVRQKIGEYETGSKAAVPIWKSYMEEVLKAYEKKEFEVPGSIVFVNIDQETGKAATQKTKYRLSQAFIAGTEPQEIAKNSPQSKKLKEENTEFFKEDF